MLSGLSSTAAGWRRGAARLAGGRLLAAALAAAVLLGGLGPVLAQRLRPVEGFADLVERVGPAVVNISTRKDVGGGPAGQPDRPDAPPAPQFPPGSPFEDFFREFFDRDRQRGEPQTPRRNFSLGSGFVIDPSGFVVTNNHVIAEADEITVIFNDDSEYPARLIGRDSKTDLALLKIERPEPFPYVRWADSDGIRVGDWMFAIGNPFGLGSSVTAGIVSARGRDIRAGPYDDFIQVDAAINRGNSGGPSFTIDGAVFGVNTAIFSPSGGNVGIGFAIPSNLAKPVIDSLMRTGRVARGWLGVRIQSVTAEIAESLGLPEDRGALVASVTPGGPAARAGIQAGDVILDFDGKAVDRMRSLPRLVAETSIGKEADVRLWRRGEEVRLNVTVGELPDDERFAELGQPAPPDAPPPAAQARIEPLGMTVRALAPELKTQFNLNDDARGVVVTEVAGDSPSAEQDIRAGDLIVEVGQEEVGSPPEVLARVNQAKGEGKKSILLLVDRQGDLRFVALRFRE